MKVKYFAYLRDYAGCKEESISGSSTALTLLHVLAKIHGPTLGKHILTEDGKEIHEDLIFLINGRNVDFLQGKDSVIDEGAVVSLFPRIAGG